MTACVDCRRTQQQLQSSFCRTFFCSQHQDRAECGSRCCGSGSCTGFLPQEISPCCPTSSVRRNGGSQHEHSFGSTTGKGLQGITDSAAGVRWPSLQVLLIYSILRAAEFEISSLWHSHKNCRLRI